MPVTVNKDTCLGCGACTGACPVGAITIGDDGLAGCDKDSCMSCLACVATCPAGAITED